MVPPVAIGLALLLGLLVLLPARRLQLAGFSSRATGWYALVVWVGCMAAALVPGIARWLFPMLLIAWLGPFVVAPERLGRILRIRRSGR